MTTQPALMTRPEVAALITELRKDKVTVWQVFSNERRWGLDKARVPDLNPRVIRYRRADILRALVESKVIPSMPA